MGTQSAVADLIAEGDRLTLDTSTMISHLARDEQVSAVAHDVIDGLVREGRNDAVIATVTVSELLHLPSRQGQPAVRRMLEFLDSLEALQIRSADFLVAAEAARIRADTSLPMADALIIATAVLTSSQVLVTYDRRMAAAAREAVPEMKVVLLSEVAAV